MALLLIQNLNNMFWLFFETIVIYAGLKMMEEHAYPGENSVVKEKYDIDEIKINGNNLYSIKVVTRNIKFFDEDSTKPIKVRNQRAIFKRKIIIVPLDSKKVQVIYKD